MWPSPAADANNVRVEISFYRADTLEVEVRPFEARWANNPWPEIGQPMAKSELSLRSTGHSSSIDFLTTPTSDANEEMFWWNDYSANHLFDPTRRLKSNDYFVRVEAIGHDLKAERWLRLTRSGAQPPTLTTCDKPSDA
jgi:hypothetical protein